MIVRLRLGPAGCHNVAPVGTVANHRDGLRAAANLPGNRPWPHVPVLADNDLAHEFGRQFGRARVARLLDLGRPSAVPRLVVAVYVDAIDRCTDRALSHVGKKAGEPPCSPPLFANGNASACVESVVASRRGRARAPSNHLDVGAVRWRRSRRGAAPGASSAGMVSRSSERVDPHFAVAAAIASAVCKQAGSPRIEISSVDVHDGQRSESGADSNGTYLCHCQRLSH